MKPASTRKPRLQAVAKPTPPTQQGPSPLLLTSINFLHGIYSLQEIGKAVAQLEQEEAAIAKARPA